VGLPLRPHPEASGTPVADAGESERACGVSQAICDVFRATPRWWPVRWPRSVLPEATLPASLRPPRGCPWRHDWPLFDRLVWLHPRGRPVRLFRPRLPYCCHRPGKPSPSRRSRSPMRSGAPHKQFRRCPSQRIHRVVHLPSTIAERQGQHVGKFGSRDGPKVMVPSDVSGTFTIGLLARVSNVGAGQSLLRSSIISPLDTPSRWLRAG
jgi:hypothetical protein